jgi:F-type H+-transporting ATPase subunit b
MRIAKLAIVAVVLALGGAAEAKEGQAKVSGAVTHHDMYRYFNIADDLSLSPSTDVLGGKLGDGRNVSPDGKILIDDHGQIAGEEKRPPAFVFMLLNFAVFAWLVAKFARPAASKLAAERHDQIKTALDEAAKLRKEAADKLAEYESRLKAADDEVKKLVEGMKADAESDKKRILAAAEAQAAQLKREAEQRIAAEIMYARAQLTRDVTAAATAVAEKILREKLQPTDQQALVARFVSALEGGASEKETH